MAVRSPFAGADQGDVAFLELNGVAYRCFVWLTNTTRSFTVPSGVRHVGATVEAVVYIEQPHGESVEFWRGIVRTPATDNQVDCPRVVSMGQSFHVHWIEADPEETDAEHGTGNQVGMELHRSTFDVEDIPSAWAYQGAISTGYMHLYDTQSLGTDDDYILAHATLAGGIGVHRVNGDSWVDTEWVTAIAAFPFAENVMAVSANRAAPMVVYQVGTALHAIVCDWTTGTAGPDTAITSSLGEFTAVGTCIRDDVVRNEVWLVAEFLNPWAVTGHSGDLPAVLHGEVDTAALGLIVETVTPNVSLQSKPWRYVSTREVSTQYPQFFAVLGYTDDATDQEMRQSNQYVARFEQNNRPLSGRPILVATLSVGIANASPHGDVPPQSSGTIMTPSGGNPHKRRNHIPSASPAPSFGPLQKSYTTFLGRWSRIDTTVTLSGPGATNPAVTVAGAGLECTRFHHDTPWAFPYDDSDNPILPTVPYASVGPPQLESAPAGAGLFFSGGTPQTYDGSRFVEAGFPWRPEVMVTEAADGPLPAGNYYYTAVYEWRDARGQTHRSEPCPPVWGVNSGGNGFDIAVRCVNLSAKDNPALGAISSPIKIDVYRTESGGSLFYPLYRGNDGNPSDLTAVPQNVRGAAVVWIGDDAPDASINNAVPLDYTQVTGAWSPLPGETIPALGAIASWQNRIVGVSSEETKRLWISREILPESRGEKYTVPEFAAALTFRIDAISDRIVAMQEMDSALILFTRNAIYALHGTPGDATGQGSTLQVQLMQRDTGCVEPRSIAPAPDGIYFQSRRGLYKLTRQNTLEFVGADVEDEIRAGGNIRAVTVHEDSHQVRVLCNAGPYDAPQVLVYDWLFKMWAVWPLPSVSNAPGRASNVDALVWRGHEGEHTHVVLQAGGVLVQKSTTSATRYADESGTTATVAIPVDVRTGWIHLAGLAGFKRVRKVGLHFAKAAAAGLTVRLEYDLDGTQTTGANLQSETFASPCPAYIEIRTAIQKCTSIRIRIYESGIAPTGDQLTASTLNLVGVTLTVARKPGIARVSPTTQRS